MSEAAATAAEEEECVSAHLDETYRMKDTLCGSRGEGRQKV
jgi:hypothetical protein